MVFTIVYIFYILSFVHWLCDIVICTFICAFIIYTNSGMLAFIHAVSNGDVIVSNENVIHIM